MKIFFKALATVVNGFCIFILLYKGLTELTAKHIEGAAGAFTLALLITSLYVSVLIKIDNETLGN